MSRRAALARRAPLALVVLSAGLWPALVQASLPGASAPVASDSRAVAALDHLALSAVADSTTVSDFTLFAGNELGRALGLGDDASRFALGLDAGMLDVDVDGLVLASRVRELGFHPLQGLDLVDAAPLRGPPDSEPKTRIGGSDLFLGTRIGEKGELSLGLRWACDESGCGLAEGKPLDPLGLEGEVGPNMAEIQRSRNDTVDTLDQLKIAAGVTAEMLDLATDLGPGIGQVKLANTVLYEWSQGNRKPAYLVAGTVAGGAAVAILARRFARLGRVGAKAVNDIDEATLAAERRAAAAINEQAEQRSLAKLSKSLEASGEAPLATALPQAGQYRGMWRMGSSPRGYLVEDLIEAEGGYGNRLPYSFKTVDFHDPGRSVTSVKSLDLMDDTYRRDPRAVFQTVKSYIDKVRDFEGGKRSGYVITRAEAKSVAKKLELAIPPGSMVPGQRLALEEAEQYAKREGVNIRIFTVQ